MTGHWSAEREELGFGLGEGGFEFLEQGGAPCTFLRAAEVFEFLGKLDDALGAQVEAHALERVGVEGQHRPVIDRLADLRDALRGAFQEQVHQFLQHADAVGGRHVAQFER